MGVSVVGTVYIFEILSVLDELMGKEWSYGLGKLIDVREGMLLNFCDFCLGYLALLGAEI